MHLVFDIFQGIGIAAAVGVRPFLPALLVGVLGTEDVQIDFKGTDFSFLQRTPWLLAMVVCAIVLAYLERRLGPPRMERRSAVLAVGAIGLAMGALLFAGALSQAHRLHTFSSAWPGYPAGIACALVGVAATRPLLARVRARLDAQAAGAVTLYAEAFAVVVAVLSVVAPPAGVVALLALLWLVAAGRRRSGQKYAGLRILR
jgi:hypothetical protein